MIRPQSPALTPGYCNACIALWPLSVLEFNYAWLPLFTVIEIIVAKSIIGSETEFTQLQ
jgi:hypothetical protein